MTRVRLAAVALVVMALGLVLVVRLRDRDESEAVADTQRATGEIPSVNTGDARVNWAIHRLREQVAALERKLNESRKPSVAVAGVSGESGEKAHEGSANLDEQAVAPLDPYQGFDAVEREQAMADDLTALLEAEPVDPEWRAETEALAHESASGVGEMKLVSVECHSTLCRARVAHEGSTDRSRVVSELTAKPPYNTQGFVRMLDTDPSETEVYFVRAGHQISVTADGLVTQAEGS